LQKKDLLFWLILWDGTAKNGMVQCIPNGFGSLHLRCQRQWLRCLSQTSYTPQIVCNQERSILHVYTAKTVYSCFDYLVKNIQGCAFVS